MNVTGGFFEEPSPGDPWVARVWVFGDGFVSRAAPPFAVVGDVVVQGIVTAPDDQGFSGTLASEPADGAHLKVGWSPDELTDTDVVYTAPAVA